MKTLNESIFYRFIMGADDPEMERISSILTRSVEEGLIDGEVHFATVAAKRCHPGNAYRADAPVWGPAPEGLTPMVVAIECGGDWEHDFLIDHHNPGDPGHGLGPDRFMEGSSIGQLLALFARMKEWGVMHTFTLVVTFSTKLKASIASDARPGDYINSYEHHCLWLGDDHAAILPWDIVAAAASDHCLSHAYAGECPGVDPDDLAKWRAKVRAKFQGVDAKEVMKNITAARKVLMSAPRLDLGDDLEVADTRGLDTGREGGEASAQLGLAVYYEQGKDDPFNRSGRTKAGLIGGSPEEIRQFMEVWGPANGLMDIYGAPERGYAGGYLD